jgi:hypothetical protein
MKPKKSSKFPLSLTTVGLVSLGAAVLVGLAATRKASAALPVLPHEPYPYTQLPISSRFNEKILEPFKLLAAFGNVGLGEVLFEDSYLRYTSGGWSWLVTRTEWQSVVNAKWVWKAVKGDGFIIEAWDAYANNVGRTAMILFRNGKVYHLHDGNYTEVYLMDFDPFKDFVTVRMTIDYTIPEIRDLYINDNHFSHLIIRDEPIGKEVPFWQMQIFLPWYASILVQEMQA